MFGIGAGELVLIAIVVLLAVGPDQMPKMLRTVGGAMRQVRKATRELQSTVGMDQILNDEDLRDLRELRDPLQMKPKAVKPGAQKEVAAAKAEAGASRRSSLTLTDDDYAAEQNELGVDLDLAYARAEAAELAVAAKTTSPEEPSA